MDTAAYEFIYKTEEKHWWYRVRREIIHDLLSHYVKKDHPLAMLDVGCGMGLLMKEMQSYGTPYGVDMSLQAIAFCKARGLTNVALSDGLHVPFPDAAFDVVFALDVLEHIEDDDAALAEMKRVLKPHGVLIIFVPTFMFLWGMSDEVGRHVRRYRLPALSEKVTSAGFSISRRSYFNTFLFPVVAIVRFILRQLPLKPKLEYENPSIGLLNTALYALFHFESKVLRRMNFPFGVSGLLVCIKQGSGATTTIS